ncbi:hypothetical protein [Blastococcus sp. SYSU DS0539]
MPAQRKPENRTLPKHVYPQGTTGKLWKTIIPLGNGKTRTVSGFTSPTNAAKYYDLAVEELRAGRPLPPKSIVEQPRSGRSLRSYIQDIWWPRYKRQGVPGKRGPRWGRRPQKGTLEGRRRIIDRYILTAPWADWPMRAINHDQVQEYLDRLAAEAVAEGTDKPLAKSTLNQVSGTLWRIYDQAINMDRAERIVDHNPAAYVVVDEETIERRRRGGAEKQHEHEREVPERALEWDEVFAVHQRMLPSDRYVFWAISGLSMRIGEAAGVFIVDFLDASAAEGDGYGYLHCGHRMQLSERDDETGEVTHIVERGKTRSAARRLTLGPTSTAFLREYIQRFHGFDPFDPTVPRNDPRRRVPIYVLPQGGPPKDNGSAFRGRLDKILTDLGLTEKTVGHKVTPHWLRKTVATQLLDDRRVPEVARAKYLGHKLEGIVDEERGVRGAAVTAAAYSLLTLKGLSTIAKVIEEVLQTYYGGDLWAVPKGTEDLLTIQEAAALLDVRPHSVRRLIHGGHLQRQMHPDYPHRHYVAASELAGLQERFSDANVLTRAETARRLRVGNGVVSTLISRGLLVQVTTPFGSNGTRSRVTVASIEEYERKAAADGSGLAWVSLEEAAGQLNIPLKDLRARVRERVAQGRLRARKSGTSGRTSAYTHIAEEDLTAWRERLKIPEGYVGARRAKELIGASNYDLRNWRLAGRVRHWTDGRHRGVGELWWYSIEDLRRIAAETAPPGDGYVRLQEAIDELGASYSVVRRLLENGVVEHVRRSRGPQKTIVWVHRERLRKALAVQGAPNGYITVSEAAAQYGLAPQLIAAWARRGRVKAQKLTMNGRDQWYVHGRSLARCLRSWTGGLDG